MNLNLLLIKAKRNETGFSNSKDNQNGQTNVKFIINPFIFNIKKRNWQNMFPEIEKLPDAIEIIILAVISFDEKK